MSMHARTHARTASPVRDGRDPPDAQGSAQPGAGEPPAPRPPLRRALVVEDEDSWFRAVERAVRAHGWSCEHARSVAEARALLVRSFDAVLVDLDLGAGGRGEDVLTLLAARPTPVPTVVLSAYANQAVANVLGLDGIPFLDKMAGLATLLATLEQEVGLNRLMTARGLVGVFARVEKRLLCTMLDALRATGGNQSRAARRLGIPRTTLQDRMKVYGLRSAAFRRQES